MILLLVFAATAVGVFGEAARPVERAVLLKDVSFGVKLMEDPRIGLSLAMQRDGISSSLVELGRHGSEIRALSLKGSRGATITFDKNVTLQITYKKVMEPRRGLVISLAWRASPDIRLEDCVSLGNLHWYGGPQQKRQYWPVERLQLRDYSYTTKESDNCGVAEPYWLSSAGTFYFFDRKVPLFVDQNSKQRRKACFIAEVKPPYSNKRMENNLVYDIGVFDDARQAHEYAIAKYLNKPSGIPDEKMITYPIWSTWARYKINIDHDVVLKFADEINGYGFPNSQFEIDDLWEICYGSQTVDVRRFPDMKNTVDTLKAKGFRVTVWSHPFLNKGCEPWYSDAKEKGYLVTSETGSVETSWWNNNGTTAAYLDFTKPEVQTWYTDRLQLLQDLYGIDSFKFDAGETSWSPQVPNLQGYVLDQPGVITEDYVRTVAKFGPLTEVRSAYRTQDLPIFVRIIDKDSYWNFENGLPTLVTTMLQMNMNGYPLVLPDMIGGNGYEGAPSKELFIRWLQANVFMPSLQFSYVPWDYDDETIAISKTMVELHAKYAPAIIEACKKAVEDGSPVNPPLWWIDPTDPEAHEIWDEFLLGENIVVAPVLERGVDYRDVYLPAGVWLPGGDTTKQLPGGWYRDYPAPLDTLPFFVRA